jgi:NitT/TauT family transport system substrate-binding protein
MHHSLARHLQNGLRTLAQLAALAALLSATDASLAEERKMRLGVMRIAAMATPYVAKEQGFFSRHGLEVELVPIRSGAEGIQAMQGGNVEATLAIPSFAMAANERRFDLVMVYQNELAHDAPPDSGGVLVREDSPVRSLKDLAGRTIGVNALHAQEAVSAQFLLLKAGLTKDQVKYVEAPHPSLGDLLVHGQADAVVTIDPFTTMIRKRGARVIAWEYAEAVPGQPIGTFWSKRAWAERNADLIEAFTEAMDEAIAWVNADPVRTQGVVAEFTKLPLDIVKAMPMIVWSSKIDLERWSQMIAMLKTMGEIRDDHKPQEYFHSVVLRRLGQKG